MNRKNLLVGLTLLGTLAYGAACMAQQPVVNIGERHGNLRNAQENIVEAWQLISSAQADNNDRLGGHAQRAKDLLTQADAELRMAADAANANGRPW